MTEQSESRLTILPSDINGVMTISGYRGIGKSYLASQADLPNNILFLDFESKGAGIDAQLEFGSYRALTQEAGEDPQALYRISYEAIETIKPNQFTVAILDNVSPFELALNAEAANNAETYATRYGLNLKNVKAGRFGGTKAIVNFMISDICAKLHSKGVKLIITTAHVKPRWSTAGPIPNKYNVKGADRWQELSILSLILIPGDKPPVPSALVQKEQLGTISINATPDQIEAMKRGDAGHTIARRLPPKISECTFQKIRWYLCNPVDFAKLSESERPSLEERDPFDKGLSKEQFSFIQSEIEYQTRQDEEQKEVLETMAVLESINSNPEMQKLVDAIRPLDRNGKLPSPPALRKQLAESGLDFPLPKVAQAITAYNKSKK